MLGHLGVNVHGQRTVLRKGLVKSNKLTGITAMWENVSIVHPNVLVVIKSEDARSVVRKDH